MDQATVYVVEDDADSLKLIERLLSTEGMSVLSFSRAADFLANYENHSPECLLLDLRLPGLDGLELQQRLLRRGILIPVVFITGFGKTSEAVRAMKEGAVDFLQKPFRGADLLVAVRSALAKDKSAWERTTARSEVMRRLSRLTPRERQILQVVVEGLSSKEIAAHFGLSKKTVDLHRSRIMTKMQAGTIVNLVKMALMDEEIAEHAPARFYELHRPSKAD